MLLFANGRERTVAGSKDCLVRERQNFLLICAKRVCIGNRPAAHRPGEDGISHNGERLLQSTNEICNSPLRVTPRQPGCDRKPAQKK